LLASVSSANEIRDNLPRNPSPTTLQNTIR
jgi:hypothetical protein